MKNWNNSIIAIAVGVAFATPASANDPRNRDEDISATEISVNISRANGTWKYEYTIAAAAENKGTVQFFNIDLACNNEVSEWETFDPSMHVSGSFDDYSEHAATTPTAIAAGYGQAYDFGLTRDDEAMFALDLDPGESATGLVLVSPYGPKQRAFRLSPDFTVTERWDYPEDAEEHEDIPSVDDFTINGLIKAPACPGDEIDEPEPELFDGSTQRWESPESNRLLRYATPTQDRFRHPLSGNLLIHIYYSTDIDPKTFKVEPARNGVRRLFDPKPGTSQEVSIPLEKGLSKLKFEVFAVRDSGQKGKRSGLDRDVDFFEFREFPDEPGNRGNER